MAGRLYATRPEIIEENYKKAYTEVYTENEGLREPDIVTGDAYYDASTLGYMKAVTEDNTSYETATKFKETLQTEYNEIVALIYNAGGYYVGRYETSNITETKETAINVVAGTNSGISNINWYYMYAQQKVYATNKNLGNKVKSYMILGSCFDQMLEFVNVAGKYDVTKVGNVGHSFSSTYNTGSQSTDMSKNIYDLEGNVCEWTTEALEGSYRIPRGGCCDESYSASCRRIYLYPYYPFNCVRYKDFSFCFAVRLYY